MGMKCQFSSGSFWEDQIICADFHFARLAHKTKMANLSVDSPCGARRLNGLSRSSKKPGARFFTTPVSSTAALGLLVSTTSPPTSVWDSGWTCQSARYASITAIRYSVTDITEVVISISAWAINFERIYAVAV